MLPKVRYLLRHINPTTTWGDRLKALTDAFPAAPGAEFWHTGFPPDWSAQPLWQQAAPSSAADCSASDG